MMKMTWLKFGPARAQTKIQKILYFLFVFNTFAHLLASAALHMASALRAPLATICKNHNYGDFYNSVLKLREETEERHEVAGEANEGMQEPQNVISLVLPNAGAHAMHCHAH